MQGAIEMRPAAVGRLPVNSAMHWQCGDMHLTVSGVHYILSLLQYIL